jgi:hypothetical protein
MEKKLDIKKMKQYYHRKGGRDKMRKICEAFVKHLLLWLLSA